MPTSDWKVLKVAKPEKPKEGQHYILQINKAVYNILYSRLGKKACVVGSVSFALHVHDIDDIPCSVRENNCVNDSWTLARWRPRVSRTMK